MNTDLRPITPAPNHNYVAFFLSLACNLKCPYCINLHELGTRSGQLGYRLMTADEWVRAANRLMLREDLPLTLQGGEPTLHEGFFQIVNEVKREVKMDLMTNLTFDVDRFIAEVPVWRFTRNAPYASIRASYHPGQNRIEDLVDKTLRLQAAGFRVGLYSVLHPEPRNREHILEVQKECLEKGLDFRTKEYLGLYKGKVYGTIKYEGSVGNKDLRMCDCRTTELVVNPQGQVHRCHAFLYNNKEPIGHILDPSFSEGMIDEWRLCSYYGRCNPCDVKVKTNRLQVYGHTSCEIRDIMPISDAGDTCSAHAFASQ